MGGYGSGMSRSYKKSTADDCLQLDSNNFARCGSFKLGMRYGNIKWSQGEHEIGTCGYWSDIRESEASISFLYNERHVPIRLSWYAPGFGGRRYFFLCPVCGRRTRTLFFNQAAIACRICHDLTYESCNKSHHFDSLYKRMVE